MAEKEVVINKERMENYLKQFAEFYEKNGGTKQFYIIVVGGSAIVLNHSFRDETHDVDASYPDDERIAKAIEDVNKANNLNKTWMNKGIEYLDPSYTRLKNYTTDYAVYGKVTVKVVDTDHLIAMKLYAGRQGANDRADIIGLFIEEANAGRPVTFERVEKAIFDLYDSWDNCTWNLKKFLEIILDAKDLMALRGVYGRRDVSYIFQNKDIINATKKMTSIKELKEYMEALGIDAPEENLKLYMERIQQAEGELSDDDLDKVVGGVGTEEKSGREVAWAAYTESCLAYQKINPNFKPMIERGVYANGEWATVKYTLLPNGQWIVVENKGV